MAIESLDPSVDQTSGPRRGAYPIPLSPATTTGFIGRTERGPVNEPVRISSFPEYCRYFGGHLADGSLSHAVHDYFLHCGQSAVVVRLTNRARRAHIELPTESDEILHLQARYPGRHECLRVSIDYERVEADPSQFNLVVQRLDSTGSRLIEDQELYPLVSTLQGNERFIADVLADSRLIAVAGPVPAVRPLATPPDRPGEAVQYIYPAEQGDDGDELSDYDIVGSDRDRTGLFALARGPRIDLLAVPMPPDKDLGSTAFVAASRFCEKQRAMLILDPPTAWQSADAAMLGARRLDFSSSNVMTYFPRIRPRGARMRHAAGLPACGAIAGMLAARDRRGVFGRDEENDYTLRAALAPMFELSPVEAQRLARYGINAFVRAGGGATRLTGRVTMGASGLGSRGKQSLERRRLASFILKSIEDAVASQSEASDLAVATQRAEWQLRRFFDDLYVHGALQGSTPGQAFYLQPRGATSGRPSLHFGFALEQPSRFAEYLVDLAGEQAGRVQRIQALEAEQFFS